MAIKTNEGKLIASGLKFGVVVARFNEFISSKLLGGVIDGLIRHGASEEDIEISWVPGAFEIPLVAQKMANSKKFDAIICIGAVIRGSTPHFDYVANEMSKGIAKVSLDTEYQLLLVSLPRIPLNRPLKEREPRLETKAMMQRLRQLKWQIC